MEIKFLLDFDGVLFNSAFEAYTVANSATSGRASFRQDVSFEEFLEFRSVVTDAWQYNRLYHIWKRSDLFTLPDVDPDHDDWTFAKDFFAARAVIMRDHEWPKVMSPYDFFFLIKPMLLEHRDKFAILSTRNVESIRQTMAFFDADVVPIFGQEDIRRVGSKLGVAIEQGWIDGGHATIVYLDDMNAHLEPFEGMVHLPLHADWGYDRATVGSLNQHQVISIIASLLKLTDARQEMRAIAAVPAAA